MIPSELMIGDCMRIAPKYEEKEFAGKTFKLIGMRRVNGGFKIWLADGLVVFSNEDYVNKVIEPIPLTDESIEKNGFKPFPIEKVISKNLVGKWWHKSGRIYIKKYVLWQGEYVYMVGLDSHIRIGGLKYFHELQHALRLCGLSELADNFKLEEGGKQ